MSVETASTTGDVREVLELANSIVTLRPRAGGTIARIESDERIAFAGPLDARTVESLQEVARGR